METEEHYLADGTNLVWKHFAQLLASGEFPQNSRANIAGHVCDSVQLFSHHQCVTVSGSEKGKLVAKNMRSVNGHLVQYFCTDQLSKRFVFHTP